MWPENKLFLPQAPLLNGSRAIPLFLSPFGLQHLIASLFGIWNNKYNIERWPKECDTLGISVGLGLPFSMARVNWVGGQTWSISLYLYGVFVYLEYIFESLYGVYLCSMVM